MASVMPETMEAPQPTKSRTGCWIFGIGGAGCLFVILLCGGFVGVAVVGATAMIKNSDPYKESLQATKQDPVVIASVGEPMEPGFFVQGNINLKNSGGDANMTYSVSGPNGSANVHVVGTKANGAWTYQTMTATTSDGKTVDLNAVATP